MRNKFGLRMLMACICQSSWLPIGQYSVRYVRQFSSANRASFP